MTNYQVTIYDYRRRVLRSFVTVGTHGQAMRAGNLAADALPDARHMTAKPI